MQTEAFQNKIDLKFPFFFTQLNKIKIVVQKLESLPIIFEKSDLHLQFELRAKNLEKRLSKISKDYDKKMNSVLKDKEILSKENMKLMHEVKAKETRIQYLENELQKLRNESIILREIERNKSNNFNFAQTTRKKDTGSLENRIQTTPVIKIDSDFISEFQLEFTEPQAQPESLHARIHDLNNELDELNQAISQRFISTQPLILMQLYQGLNKKYFIELEHIYSL